MKKISKYFILSIYFISPVILFAIDFPPGGGGSGGNNSNISIPNPTNAGSTLMEVLTAILNNVVMPVAAVAVVVWIIWAGFTYITAQGKPAEIQKANQRLLWSLIGAGILLGAAGISLVVQNTIKGLIN